MWNFDRVVELSVVWQLIRHGDSTPEHYTIQLRSRQQLAVIPTPEQDEVCLASDCHAAVVLTQTHDLSGTRRHREWPSMDGSI